MTNIKKAIPIIAISCLFLVVFNVLAFILAEELNTHFWCGYVFIALSFLCLFGVELLAFTKNDNGKSVFLNAPSILVTVIHLVVQLILGIMVMAVQGISIKAIFSFEIVIFAIYFAVVGCLEIYKHKNKWRGRT